MKNEWKKLFRIGVCAFLLYLCIHYWTDATTLVGNILGAAAPLFIGFAIAYLVNIPMSFYERHYFPKSQKKIVQKTRRPFCMLLSFLSILAFVALVVWLVVPQLIECVQLLLIDLSKGILLIVDELTKRGMMPDSIADFLDSVDWKSRIEQIIGVVTSGVGGLLSLVIGAVSSVFSGIVTALLSFIFSVYFLSGKDKLQGQTKRVALHFLKETHYNKIKHVLDVANQCFRRFIIGQVTEAVILGLLCTVGMLIFQFPYATVIGALVTFMALIPIAGAYISAAVGAVLIFTVSPIQALGFLVFIIVLQQLEGNLIYPRVVGSSLGLPGLWVLTAVTIGGGIMGIFGMLIFVPLAATLYTLLRERLNKPRHQAPVSPTKEKETKTT